MFNNAVLVGRMANDPELKYTPSGVAVSTFRIAVNRPFPNKEGQREADFLNVVAWRQQAEFAANYLGKGRLVLVEGRIQVRSYDAQDGQRHKVWEIVSDNLRGLDRPKGAAAAGVPAATSAAAPGAEGQPFDDPFQDE
jgi:single-strand DNA-binding protein